MNTFPHEMLFTSKELELIISALEILQPDEDEDQERLARLLDECREGYYQEAEQE